MLYPARMTWFDKEPEPDQAYTTCHTVRTSEELETALDRFEQDACRLELPLLSETFDREGHCLTVGFTPFRGSGFVTFQSSHMLTDERGHFRFAPLKWSVSNPADAARLPSIIHVHGQDRICFMHWPGFDPTYVMPDYCVPFPLVRQAVREYLVTGEFSPCIGWGEGTGRTTTRG